MPTHTHSTTHGQMPGSRYSRRLHRESWALRGMVAESKAPGRACGRGGMGRHGRRTRRRLRLENAVTRIAGERASTRRQASATYIYIKDPGGLMGGPCGFRIPMTRPVCARGAPKRRPSVHGANSVSDDVRIESNFLCSRVSLAPSTFRGGRGGRLWCLDQQRQVSWFGGRRGSKSCRSIS